MRLSLVALAGAVAMVMGLASMSSIAGVTLTDTDLDGVPDEWDNCSSTSNTAQDDCNGDGYGNACDADYNNDGLIGGPDFGAMSAAFLSMTGDANYNCEVDCNSDGLVGGPDFGCLSASFLGTPGPSGLACADPTGATAPCTGI